MPRSSHDSIHTPRDPRRPRWTPTRPESSGAGSRLAARLGRNPAAVGMRHLGARASRSGGSSAFLSVFLLLCVLSATAPALAQDIYAVPSDGSTATISACSGVIVDDGLAAGPYTDGGSGILRVYPNRPDRAMYLTVLSHDVDQGDALRIGFSPTTDLLIKDPGQDALATPHSGFRYRALWAEEDYLEVRFESADDGNGGDGFEIEIACVDVEAIPIGPSTATTSCGVHTTDSGGVDGDYDNDQGLGATFESLPRRRTAVELRDYSITAPDELTLHLGPARSLEIAGDESSEPYYAVDIYYADEGEPVQMVFVSDASEVAAGWETHVLCYDLIDESTRSARGGISVLEPRAFIVPSSDDNGEFLPSQTAFREFEASNEDLDLIVYVSDRFEGPDDRLSVRDGSGGLLGTVEFGDGEFPILVPNGASGPATVRFDFLSNDDGLEGYVTAQMADAIILGADRDDSSHETCGVYLFDSGGLTGGVGANEDYTTTLTPRNPGAVMELLIAHDLQDGFDFLRVFDGDSTSGTLLAELTGSAVSTVLGTRPGRAVTLQVVSDATDGTEPTSGWSGFAGCTLEAIFRDGFESGTTSSW